ncbi:MAG: hypothetical protein OXH06_19250 [Gemmatimonadetes bacterium]|nr:hypothetical protein [Gemmatimonadota bacterium]
MKRAKAAYEAFYKQFDKIPSRKWDDEQDSVKQIWADVANAAIGVQDDSYFDYIIAQMKNRNLSESDVAAIIVTRLEKHLRDITQQRLLCQGKINEMPGGNKPSIRAYNRVLKMCGVYTNDVGTRIDKIAHFRADAAHGKPTGLTQGEIVNHVNFVRQFFAKYAYKISLSGQTKTGPPTARAKLTVSRPTE